MLGLREEEGSKRQCSQPSQGWNIVNESLFLPALIVGSFTKVPSEWARIYSVTLSPGRKGQN